jgi:hypothetical protein
LWENAAENSKRIVNERRWLLLRCALYAGRDGWQRWLDCEAAAVLLLRRRWLWLLRLRSAEQQRSAQRCLIISCM